MSSALVAGAEPSHSSDIRPRWRRQSPVSCPDLRKRSLIAKERTSLLLYSQVPATSCWRPPERATTNFRVSSDSFQVSTTLLVRGCRDAWKGGDRMVVASSVLVGGNRHDEVIPERDVDASQFVPRGEWQVSIAIAAHAPCADLSDKLITPHVK